VKPADEGRTLGITGDKKLISIVVPVFNEEESIQPLYDALVPVLDPLSEWYNFEIIFTDNHSTDGTFERLAGLAERDRRVRVFRFSRNFGFQRSIFTGYMKAVGDAAVQIDCDLQDPPELIPEFLRMWAEGWHVVYGIRRSRREGWWIQTTRRVFYRLLDALSEDHLPNDAGDFRLVDRRIIDELRQIDDYQPYLRGAIASLGFRQIGIPYDRNERAHGSSKFFIRDLVALALDGILNHSVVPLRIATFTGLIVSFVTFLGLGFYAIDKLAFGRDWPAGFATTISLILLTLSLNALFLGIIGEYLGRIYKQVKKRPLTIIECQIDALGADVPSRQHQTAPQSSR
jgi:glycosyltransferase involved in cell wall biosynthesis